MHCPLVANRKMRWSIRVVPVIVERLCDGDLLLVRVGYKNICNPTIATKWGVWSKKASSGVRYH